MPCAVFVSQLAPHAVFSIHTHGGALANTYGVGTSVTILIYLHTLWHLGTDSSIKNFADFARAIDQNDEVTATKTTCNKDTGRELAHNRDGQEEHGFVLVQEAILKGGNLYNYR